MKNKKIIKILLASALSMMMLVGFAESKTELMGGNYVRFDSIHLEIDKSKFVNIIDDQIYFIADGSNENITEYCSTEDYYIKKLVVDNYKHTVAIGGDILGNISQEGGIDELGFISHVELIGELEREVDDSNIKSESLYRFPASQNINADVIPAWFEKACIENVCFDYGITNTSTVFN